MPVLNARRTHQSTGKVNFTSIAYSALRSADQIVRDLLPDGRREGHEWVARNPLRSDKRAGSFRINLTTGKWADFATDDRGGDLVSLAAYLNKSRQLDASRWLSERFGLGVK